MHDVDGAIDGRQKTSTRGKILLIIMNFSEDQAIMLKEAWLNDVIASINAAAVLTGIF